jgi:2'-5' RNA ligase
MMAGQRSDSSVAGQVRAFLAFEMSEQCRQEIAEQMSRIRTALPPARWVRPEGVHLTLKFLGDSDPEVLQALTAELTPALAELPPVAVELRGAGFFPNRSRPRVAWLGGVASGVEPVVAAIERVARHHGYSRERRAWSLHLTLARLRKPWPADAVESFLEWGDGVLLPRFQCSEVILFSSELKPTGAVYTVLDQVPLAHQAIGGGKR